MSCRLPGHRVETTALNLLASGAKRLGARRLAGEYIPTKNNGMVNDHYAKLRFSVTERRKEDGSRRLLDLGRFGRLETGCLDGGTNCS